MTSIDDELKGAEIARLRQRQNLTQAQLAQRAGVARSTVAAAEAGNCRTSHRTRARLLVALGVTSTELSRLRGWLEERHKWQDPPAGGAVGAGQVVHITISLLGRRLAAVEGTQGPAPADRAGVPELLRHLEGEPWAVCRGLVDELSGPSNWALCEALCAASTAAAAHEPRNASRLVVLALRAARSTPGTAAWRDRLLGFTLFHLANARRVRGSLPAGAKALDRAEVLWKAGARNACDLLDPSRVLDLAASFRHAQRRLREAQALLDQAQAIAQLGPPLARLLLKKAKVLEELGEFEEALATAEQAQPYLDDDREPRQRLVLEFNRVDYLRQLGRLPEAQALVPAVQALASRLGNDLDLVRLRWLEGRMATSAGRSAEARAAFREVRDAFAARGISYDFALVSLELATYLLETGQTVEVRELARECEAIFQAQQVDRERCGALLLFCQAVEREVLTLEMVRELLRGLREGSATAPRG